MTVDEIRELIALATESGIAELEVQRGDNRVRIRRSSFTTSPEIVVAAPSYTSASAPSALAAAPPSPPAPTPGAKEIGEKPHDPNLVLVRSPIVGTFYEAASPEAQPFVRIGERVQPGKVLCIIESMKLMNEIESETSGTIESKLVMNGQPVEYGEALFAVRTV
jgi:acetyl-CoA carboxylase biotin carboxyl carrier protein